MTKTTLGILFSATFLLVLETGPSRAIANRALPHAGSRTTPTYRPDAWLKLCGWGDACNHAPPHRYFGNNVYNSSGANQTVSSGLEEGNDIRFWIRLENDGGTDDTLYVKGCAGASGFVVRAVLVGALTQSTFATNVTRQFKRGTAHFDLQGNDGNSVTLTLDIWARTSVFGAEYSCPISVWSSASPSTKDQVVAKMVTCYRNCVKTTLDPSGRGWQTRAGAAASASDKTPPPEIRPRVANQK